MLELYNTSIYSATEHAFIPRNVVIDGSQIISVETVKHAISHTHSMDLRGLKLIPGLIDLHLHGAVGVDTMDGSVQSFIKLAAYEASCGVTSIVPTTMTMPFEDLKHVCCCVKTLKLSKNCSRILGLYLEGPFLNPQKCGAQNNSFLKLPDPEPLLQLEQLSGHNIRFVAVAPELPGAYELIEIMKNRGIRTTIAHTSCTYEQAFKAMQAGANHVTHLYNAMLPFHHRETGPIGACMDFGAECELISDGYHISPPAIRAAFKIMDTDNIILISDSMMATGLEDGEYQLGGQAVFVRDRKATLADGTLAGSATNLFDCLRIAVTAMGISLEDSVRACTYTPAEALGEKNLGRIEAQAEADLLVIDNQLNLHGIMLKGCWIMLPEL